MLKNYITKKKAYSSACYTSSVIKFILMLFIVLQYRLVFLDLNLTCCQKANCYITTQKLPPMELFKLI